jgi:hypothetical protein
MQSGTQNELALADLSLAPDWLRPIYHAMLFESLQVFNLAGEVELYADYLEALTDRVHRSCIGAGPHHGSGFREFANLCVLRGAHASLLQPAYDHGPLGNAQHLYVPATDATGPRRGPRDALPCTP